MRRQGSPDCLKPTLIKFPLDVQRNFLEIDVIQSSRNMNIDILGDGSMQESTSIIHLFSVES